jgi:hypothetical protein
MNVCENHNKMVVVYDGYSCPVCDLTEELNLTKSEANRMGYENDNLCDKIFELEQVVDELRKSGLDTEV